MFTPDTAQTRLRERGLRMTPQRRALLQVLEGDTSHPRAEDVATRLAERMPGVSLSTVYKALHEFADAGLVRELDLPGGLRFDPEVEDHVHVVCACCAHVEDLELPPDLRTRLATLAGADTVTGVDVRLATICPRCSTR